MLYNCQYRANRGFLKLFVGFMFFYIAWTIPLLFMAKMDMVTAFFCCVGWFFLIKGYVLLSPYLHNPFSGFYKLIYALYVLVTIIMIIRGYMIDYQYPWPTYNAMISYHLFHKHYILCYLMPLLVFVPVSSITYKPFIKYSSYAAVVMLLMTIIYWKVIVLASYKLEDDTSRNLREIFIPFMYSCLCMLYIKRKQWILSIIGFVCCFMISLVAARRGDSLINAILGVYCLYLWSLTTKSKSKKIAVSLFVAVLIIGLFYFFDNSSLFSYIHERGMEDSRSVVDEALLSQMDDWQLVFGKGLNGRYYCPLLTDDYFEGWRYVSETGFYNLVLKGGYIYALLHIIVIAYPAYLGMFRSKNYLCKSLGFFLLLSLIELYPFGHLFFDIKFFIIWTGVAVCYSKSVRMMNNNEVKQKYFE